MRSRPYEVSPPGGRPIPPGLRVPCSVDRPFPSSAVAGANPALELLPEQPHPHPHAGLRPARAVAAVCVCGVFAFLNLYATQPLLPLFAHLFRASEASVGLTVSASTLGVALAAPLFGTLAEHLSRKRVILISILVLAVPTTLVATSPGLRALIFWRFLQGLAMPGIFATIITYVGEEWRRESIALVMSFYVSSTALGGFLGRYLTGIIADAFGWRWSFAVLGALTLIGAALIARWLPPESRPIPSPAADPQLRGFRVALSHFRNTRLLATFVVAFGMLFTLVSTFTYVTFYLAAPPFRLSTVGLSNIFAIYLIGLAVTPLGGYLVTRIGMRRGILLAILCGGRGYHSQPFALDSDPSWTGAGLHRSFHRAIHGCQLSARSRSVWRARFGRRHLSLLLLRGGHNRRCAPGLALAHRALARLCRSDGSGLTHPLCRSPRRLAQQRVVNALRVELLLARNCRAPVESKHNRKAIFLLPHDRLHQIPRCVDVDATLYGREVRQQLKRHHFQHGEKKFIDRGNGDGMAA
jgi:YNFM family putative membrane transporter